MLGRRFAYSLDKGALVNLVEENQPTVLQKVIYKSDTELICLLLDRGSDANLTSGDPLTSP